MGEKPPFSNFDLTHGICQSCLDLDPSLRSDVVIENKESRFFFDEIKKLYSHLRVDSANKDIDVRWVVDQARRLNIDPANLFMGMLQPLLFEIGKNVVEGTVTVAQEHHFSHFVEKVIAAISFIYEVKEPEEPEALLACADGNYHTIGVKFLNLVLNEKGLRTLYFIPSLPLGDLKELIEHYQPQVVGVSICSVDQIQFVNELKMAYKDAPVRVVAGGGGLNKETQSKLNVDFLANRFNIFETIEYFLSNSRNQAQQYHAGGKKIAA